MPLENCKTSRIAITIININARILNLLDLLATNQQNYYDESNLWMFEFLEVIKTKTNGKCNWFSSWMNWFLNKKFSFFRSYKVIFFHTKWQIMQNFFHGCKSVIINYCWPCLCFFFCWALPTENKRKQPFWEENVTKVLIKCNKVWSSIMGINYDDYL